MHSPGTRCLAGRKSRCAVGKIVPRVMDMTDSRNCSCFPAKFPIRTFPPAEERHVDLGQETSPSNCHPGDRPWPPSLASALAHLPLAHPAPATMASWTFPPPAASPCTPCAGHALPDSSPAQSCTSLGALLKQHLLGEGFSTYNCRPAQRCLLH